MYSLTDYNYELPAELIAQQPVKQRDQSKLLGLDRQTGKLTHGHFGGIANYLDAGDVLVLNNTAVIPGRLEGRKETGGRVEVLIADYAGGLNSMNKTGNFICRCLVKASKRPSPGTWFHFEDGLKAEVLEAGKSDYRLRFYTDGDFDTQLSRIGQVPLPPYIKRNPGETNGCDDKNAYQTVYASQQGAIAAPTAGLHFTETLLDKLQNMGVKIAMLTLHVGYGTFLPVRVDDIRDHQMHAEAFTVSDRTAATINAARAQNKRVIAVGTTCVRTIEYVSSASGAVQAGSGRCDLYIYPGYRFKAVDALVTNFHLPRSTLLMLVSAFAGRQRILNAYQQAIRKKYRFYSYGDAMVIH